MCAAAGGGSAPGAEKSRIPAFLSYQPLYQHQPTTRPFKPTIRPTNEPTIIGHPGGYRHGGTAAAPRRGEILRWFMISFFVLCGNRTGNNKDGGRTVNGTAAEVADNEGTLIFNQWQWI